MHRRSAIPMLLPLLLIGCGSPDASRQPAAQTSAAPTAPTPTSARTPDSGLESSTILLRDDADRVIESLLPFESAPGGLDEATRTLWRRHGLRLIAVPVEQLPSVLGPLDGRLSPLNLAGEQRQAQADGTPITSVASITQRRITPDARWTVLARQPGQPRAETLLVGDRRLSLDPGLARLLTRAWFEPVPSDDAVPRARLRLELVPQWLDPAPRGRSIEPAEPLLEGRLAGEDELGQLFDRLRVTLTLDGSLALVLLYEPPSSDWDTLAGPRPIDRGEPDDQPRTLKPLGPGVVSRDPDRSKSPTPTTGQATAGPPTERFRSRSLGELLLAGPAAGDEPGPRVRQLLLLVPRVPSRFSLLGG
jgi:hypothetical protein